MKVRNILLLLLLFNIAYASYWNIEGEPSTTMSLEAQYNTETEAEIMQSSGIGQDFLIAVAKPFNAVRAFFTTMNHWVGEAIFLGRVISWFSLIILVQIVFVGFWILLIKIAVRLASAIIIIMDSDNVLGGVKDEYGKTVPNTKNKIFNILTKLKTLI